MRDRQRKAGGRRKILQAASPQSADARESCLKTAGSECDVTLSLSQAGQFECARLETSANCLRCRSGDPAYSPYHSIRRLNAFRFADLTHTHLRSSAAGDLKNVPVRGNHLENTIFVAQDLCRVLNFDRAVDCCRVVHVSSCPRKVHCREMPLTDRRWRLTIRRNL